MRWALLLAALPGVALAQADPATIADIRAEIARVAGEIEGLNALVQGGGGGGAALGGATGLERLAAVEAALADLTAKAEEMEFRVNRVVTDGTNRLGDLEFRICELEEGCDVSLLGDTPPLGGVDGAAAIPVAEEPPAAAGPELAVSERADYERATGALAAGDFRGAADLLAAFLAAYPGSPLSGGAFAARGEALEGLGDASNAARAYLESFSADPAGEAAAGALVGLGRTLGALGQVPDACVTLGEVRARFPAAPEVLEADAERARLQCP